MKIRAFWDVALCGLGVDGRFRSAYCLHHQGTSETSVNSKTIQCYILEDSKLYTRRRENLKSHISPVCQHVLGPHLKGPRLI
jgi:hypothetical protein